MMCGARGQFRPVAGFSLVEMVISIVVIGIAVTGVLAVMDMTSRHSADPLVHEQAVAVAEAYLEEIGLKPFADPDVAETGGSEGGETRATFDDIFDYDGLDDNGVRDQEDNDITELARYRVRVTVTPDALDDVPGSGGYDAADDAARIDVRVTGSSLVDVTVSGYRTRH